MPVYQITVYSKGFLSRAEGSFLVKAKDAMKAEKKACKDIGKWTKEHPFSGTPIIRDIKRIK